MTAANKGIEQLIINTPYREPQEYWKYEPETKDFHRLPGRRPAGYVIASKDAASYDDPGTFIAIELANQIRPRVKKWRDAAYPGVTGLTRRLLEHWHDRDELDMQRFFFCQLEAMETLIWLKEAHDSEKVGITIPDDGGAFQRLCTKMATGSGKTIVMAMLTAWHILNKLSYPKDKRFSKNVLIIAPSLTVKERLAVLKPAAESNYYEQFDIVPSSMRERLQQGRVIIHNWHALNWEDEEAIQKRRSVDKRGPKSDAAYVREVLKDMSNSRNVLVINDEAHHAWRVNPSAIGKKKHAKESIQEATIWIGALDRIHRVFGILTAHDFSATPFHPSGSQNEENSLFPWIVSDFGLNDAIESGLVKTPRIVVSEDALPDAKSYKPKLYHLFGDPGIRDDLSRAAKQHERLPDLLINAYFLLGTDWRKSYQAWKKAGSPVPPVMISVCNRTETAARIRHAFDTKHIAIEELCEAEGILHIDSKVLSEAEEQGANKKQKQAEALRKQVDTVGQEGKPGAKIKNVISVGMLSEGWDAKTVTHIMGLRAFSSQLLCEQVVGRGLRRTSYETNQDGFFEPEYVNIFGVPFSFLPHEDGGTGLDAKATKPAVKVQPEDAKSEYAISWPKVIRIERSLKSILKLDHAKAAVLQLNAADILKEATIAPLLDGQTSLTEQKKIQIKDWSKEHRRQEIIFQTASSVYDELGLAWGGNRALLLAQILRFTEQIIASDKIKLAPQIDNEDEDIRKVVITLCMTKVVRHIYKAIQYTNTEELRPVYHSHQPIQGTGDMPIWYTRKPNHRTRKSHINVCVYDSTWESADAYQLDENENVLAWVKNDHLGFEIYYMYEGVVHKYRPDFLIRMKNGTMLILETKGQESEQDKVKNQYLQEWVDAINKDGTFGRWQSAVARETGQIKDILAALAQER